MSLLEKGTDAGAVWVDDRLGSSNFVRRSINKVFPDHWSFMLGEIALYSFIILLLTGTYLSFFYTPSLTEVVYDGSYVPLKGVTMSQAYASTLDISFDVRGGLIMRQIHHWAALLFMASIVVHLMRVYFTGAFRKPREINWMIGVGLLVLGIAEGFAGYSLPDDLLSGTGARIAYSIALSIPVVGTWTAFLVFGGEYPGTAILDRLYSAHILLLPGLILGLITFHMMMIWYQKHTQFAGPGRTETNVVGSRLFPSYAAKAGGFFFLVFAVLAALGGLAQINPIWLYGPYDASQVSAGSQPDWYVGFLDGSTRLMPNWEIAGFGYTVPLNVLIPTVVLPGILFTLLALYPFLEARFTGDHEYHNLLDRPRDVPVRTAIGAMSLAFYIILMIGGGNDVIASVFHLDINLISRVLQVSLFVVPPITYVVTKRLCLALQRSDDELVHHGIESGTIRRLPTGEFVEETVPLPAVYRISLTGVESDRPQLEGATAHGEEGAPKGPGYGDQHVVEGAPEKVPGFFRAKRRSGASDTSAPRPEGALPELERSGKPAPPE
ncbi:MAG: Ubiquinol-cytochrome C reductase, cytochrome B subunit [uncultured Frankineae bacterium]|uniref:Cytochrome bc1 complex cytochrome b subunit n=1 Tax=uncultured Frankineae bacterium TaxID=437475 RepID=A0A6J4L157_9ACTN|nr:MAG: Ubiquinol-cytochrome C reductase, cytochrome B subunit [uncultured Frankineae bacterium]